MIYYHRSFTRKKRKPKTLKTIKVDHNKFSFFLIKKNSHFLCGSNMFTIWLLISNFTFSQRFNIFVKSIAC
jgi:hypothetical protein